jgi:glycosyltransferase involved in cell wall biosynthesis
MESFNDRVRYCGMESTLIVIPARDEADSIGDVIAAVIASGPFPVLVVNDGSTDATVQIALALGATVLTLPVSLGAWGAMQTGIRYALRNGFERVVTIDADGQHEPRYVRSIVDALIREGADVVIGACPERGSVPRKVAWSFFRNLTGFPIEDLTSGFRVYSRKAIAYLSGPTANLMDYQDIGVLLLLRQADMKIVEFPVEMRPRRGGGSRIYTSWWVVTRYMLETTILCLAHWTRKRDNRQ